MIRRLIAAFLIFVAPCGLIPCPAMASMLEKVPRAQYISTGGTAYTFAFPIWAKTDLRVRSGSTPQTVDTHYTVTF
ncbi:MAG: hypothetical protein PHS14_19890, partial [Elusimicrobia bacterium]|nr:hypothetical protein [Elusimicrobiota bacterium]